MVTGSISGPTRPGTDVGVFRRTGVSRRRRSGPTRPTTDVDIFRETGQSVARGSAEAARIRKDIQIKAQRAKDEAAARVRAQANLAELMSKKVLAEQQRISSLRQRLKREGAQTRVQTFTQAGTGDKIKHETLINKKEERIFTVTNLRTGKVSTRTFVGSKGRIRERGGFTETRTTQAQANKIAKTLVKGDFLLYDATTQKITGIKNSTGKTFPWTEKGIAKYNAGVSNIGFVQRPRSIVTIAPSKRELIGRQIIKSTPALKFLGKNKSANIIRNIIGGVLGGSILARQKVVKTLTNVKDANGRNIFTLEEARGLGNLAYDVGESVATGIAIGGVVKVSITGVVKIAPKVKSTISGITKTTEQSIKIKKRISKTIQGVKSSKITTRAIKTIKTPRTIARSRVVRSSKITKRASKTSKDVVKLLRSNKLSKLLGLGEKKSKKQIVGLLVKAGLNVVIATDITLTYIREGQDAAIRKSIKLTAFGAGFASGISSGKGLQIRKLENPSVAVSGKGKQIFTEGQIRKFDKNFKLDLKEKKITNTRNIKVKIPNPENKNIEIRILQFDRDGKIQFFGSEFVNGKAVKNFRGVGRVSDSKEFTRVITSSVAEKFEKIKKVRVRDFVEKTVKLVNKQTPVSVTQLTVTETRLARRLNLNKLTPKQFRDLIRKELGQKNFAGRSKKPFSKKEFKQAVRISETRLLSSQKVIRVKQTKQLKVVSQSGKKLVQDTVTQTKKIELRRAKQLSPKKLAVRLRNERNRLRNIKNKRIITLKDKEKISDLKLKIKKTIQLAKGVDRKLKIGTGLKTFIPRGSLKSVRVELKTLETGSGFTKKLSPVPREKLRTVIISGKKITLRPGEEIANSKVTEILKGRGKRQKINLKSKKIKVIKEIKIRKKGSFTGGRTIKIVRFEKRFVKRPTLILQEKKKSRLKKVFKKFKPQKPSGSIAGTLARETQQELIAISKIRKITSATRKSLSVKSLSIKQKSKIRNASKQKIKQIQKKREASKKLSRSIQRNIQKNIQKKLKTPRGLKITKKPKPTLRALRIPLTRVTRRPPKRPTPPLLPRIPKKFKKKILRKSVPVFFVKEKVKGKLKNLTPRPLTLIEAKDFLAYRLDNNLSRSGFFEPLGKSKVVVGLPGKMKGYFAKTARKYRPYKIRVGKKKSIRNGYIERTKFIQDTIGEKRQILRARRKSKKNTIKKRTPTKRKVFKKAIRRKKRR